MGGNVIIKNHLAVMYVRDSCPSNIENSCIPSILIDPESTGFSTIERYHKPVAFGTVNDCNYTGMHSQVLTLLAG